MKKFLVLAVFMAGLGLAALPALAVTYTAADVAAHNSAADCWTIMNNKVYNITAYIPNHPGGSGTITPLCGTNGTSAFSGKHAGSSSANNALAAYYIGDLAVIDNSAPVVPAGLTATAVSSSQINLSWTAATDNIAVTGYKIFRNGAQIATAAGTSYINTGLAAATAYSYAVAAYDAAGNASVQSASVSATTPSTTVTDTQAPAAPANLAASVISANQINLSWNASTDNIAVTGYQIFRNNALVATVAAISYNNLGLTASTTYGFTVKAIDAAGNVSAPSNSVSAATPAAASPAASKWQKYYDAKIKKITANYDKDVARLKQKINLALSKTTDSVKIKQINEKYNIAIARTTGKYNKDVARLNRELQKKLSNLNGNKTGWHKDDNDRGGEDDD